MRAPSFFSRSPVTFSMIGLLIAFFLLGWASPNLDFFMRLAFIPAQTLSQPWSLVTYWLVQPMSGFVLWIFFEWYWIWLVGAPLEQKLGSKGLIVAVLVASVLTAFGFSIGAIAHGNTMAALVYPETILCCLTALWAAHFSTSRICFWGFSIKPMWLAVIFCVISILHIGVSAPLLGIFAVAPAALFWLFGQRGSEAFGVRKKVVKDSRGREYGSQAEFDEFIDNVRSREKDREERERLRKLFEGSLEEDDDKKK